MYDAMARNFYVREKLRRLTDDRRKNEDISDVIAIPRKIRAWIV
jgi:hypothetical protein